jgi:hypothetical protein
MSGSQYPEEYDDLMAEITECVYSFVKERENAWNVERQALIKQCEQLKSGSGKLESLIEELRLEKAENERLRRKIPKAEPAPVAAPPASQEIPAAAAETTSFNEPAAVAPEAAAKQDTYKKVTIRGQKYFVKEGVIYEQKDPETYVRIGTVLNGQAKFDKK